MSWLSKFLEFIGIAICTAVVPGSASSTEGVEIAHIQEKTSDQAEPKWREISLNKRQDKFLENDAQKELVFVATEPDFSRGVQPFAAQFGEFAVPVLDQGQYGTCVTFATTAAIDAVLGLGDAVSQQCTLELNLALGDNYWNGAWDATQIIIPLQQYGAVRQGKCNASYPAPNAKIATKDYKKIVDASILVSAVSYQYISGITPADVKTALDAGKVVAIGFGLLNNGNPISVQGFNVVIQGQTKVGGLWACKQPSSRSNFCGRATAGHEVVIYGYDDGQQLFKIRNSWGSGVADKGDFYMTYSFFTSQVDDGTVIGVTQ